MQLVTSVTQGVILLDIAEENTVLCTFIWYSFSFPFTRMVACSVTISWIVCAIL